MGHPSEDLASIVILIVALVALFLTFVAIRSTKRSGNTKLYLVAGAFGLLAIRGLLVAYSIPSQMIGHEHLELISAMFDLGVVILLALPLFK